MSLVSKQVSSNRLVVTIIGVQMLEHRSELERLALELNYPCLALNFQCRIKRLLKSLKPNCNTVWPIQFKLYQFQTDLKFTLHFRRFMAIYRSVHAYAIVLRPALKCLYFSWSNWTWISTKRTIYSSFHHKCSFQLQR